MSEAEPLYRPFRPPESEPTISLNWKVLGVIVITVTLSTLCILIYLRAIMQESYLSSIESQVRSYALLAARLGEGLSSDEELRQAVANFPFELRIEEEGETVAVSDRAVPGSRTVGRMDPEAGSLDSAGVALVRSKGQYYAVVRGISDQGRERRTIVLIDYRHASELLVPASIAVVVALLLLIFVGWRAVRYLLKPVGELMEGVKAVGSGDFSHRVPVRSLDELGTLVSAFNAMAEQIERIIESKRRLLFDVSHELRTPLARMSIIISMLPEGKQRDRLERNANELATMITELLENERLAVLGAKLVVEEFDLVDLAGRVMSSFMDEEDRFEFDTLTEELVISGDLQRLTVALRNVMSNALKYSSPEDLPVKVSVFPDDDGARITVKDHGIGIAEESIEKIFEPFYRTDESRTRTTGGYGLGLALTRAIIDAHGGTIRAESRVGEGTTIMIWLPDTQPLDADGLVDEAVGRSDQHRKRKTTGSSGAPPRASEAQPPESEKQTT